MYRLKTMRRLIFVSLMILALLAGPAITSAQTVDHPLDVGGNVKPPTVIHAVNPTYPNHAHPHKGEVLHVIVYAVIDENGVAQNVKVTKSAGSDFDKSAIAAVHKYRFGPATMDGKPVAVKMYLQINFK